MHKILLITAIVILPILAQAQIMKCVDTQGRIEFAASCPPGTSAESTRIRSSTPGAVPAAAKKSNAERDAEFRKRRLEQAESAKKAEAKAVATADQKQNCTIAQDYLRNLQSGVRIGKTDPKTGERVFLEDAQRPAEAARAQRAVSSNCK